MLLERLGRLDDLTRTERDGSSIIRAACRVVCESSPQSVLMILKDGMDGKQFLEMALRDSVLVDALHCAVYAMAMTNGCTILKDGVNGTLFFDHEIRALRDALSLLGVDTTEPLPTPRRRWQRR